MLHFIYMSAGVMNVLVHNKHVVFPFFLPIVHVRKNYGLLDHIMLLQAILLPINVSVYIVVSVLPVYR
jgi:hypothetical protein